MTISFALFLSFWNRTQGLSTPDVHFEIAHWLEERWVEGDKDLLLMAFRSCGKSTLVGLFCTWLFFKDPDLRILVLAADLQLALKMVRNVKRIIERHPLTLHLKPEKLDQWGNERFTLNRSMELRDPSMLARGIGSNITGSRADIVICDDVEVPNTSDTATKRADLRDRLSEISYVLVPGGTKLFVGTPHTYFTIYAESPRTEIGEEHIFLEGFKRLKRPLLNEQGQSVWKDRYSLREIERMKAHTGPNKFKSQMMLEPVNIAQGRLNPEQLQFYDDELKFRQVHGQTQWWLCNKKIESVSAWWDPSFGKEGGDHSVLACLFVDKARQYYLHRLCYIKVDPDKGEDEATQQCEQVVHMLKSLYIPSLSLEINGIGRFLPSILRKVLNAQKVRTSVTEISQRRPKDLRILEAFDAVLAARALYVHKSVQKTPFVMEMQEWRPEISKGHDDGLDAVAGALSQNPVRFGSMGHHKSYKARTMLE